jgi:transcriptional regulator with AAA-type ATPase domain
VGPPVAPDSLLRLLERAGGVALARVPVLIVGERGTGKRTAARALHAAAGTGPMVRVSPLTAAPLRQGRLPAGPPHRRAGTVTLFTDGIDSFPGEAEATLVEWLADGVLPASEGSLPFWLIATTSADLEALSREGSFDRALASRLGEIVIEMPALRERRSAIGMIAGTILASVGASLGRTFALTPAAVSRLESFPWPGNLEQLAQVLRRSALLAAGDRLGPDDLLFEADSPKPECLAAPTAAATIAVASEATAEGNGGRAGRAAIEAVDGAAEPPAAGALDVRLELVLTELAHELKNPMVTIKTFADHLPSLLEDAELRERFAALTNEAIGRMDGLLDNVLDFARLGSPRAEPVALADLLDGALEAIAPELEERQARVSREGWNDGTMVQADPKHLGYAFRNLLESLVAELPHDRELSVGIGADATVELRFAGAVGVTTKLQSFLDAADGVPAATALPLRFVLARAILRRGGGEVSVQAAEGEDLTVVQVVAGPGAMPRTA